MCLTKNCRQLVAIFFITRDDTIKKIFGQLEIVQLLCISKYFYARAGIYQYIARH